MKIYFHIEESADLLETKDSLKYLKQGGAEIINSSASKMKSTMNDVGQPLDKVDALVVQAKKLDAQSGYLIALALTKNKHVLCLLPQNTRLDASIDQLKKNSKYLNIQFYTDNNLQNKIFDFLKIFDKSSLSDVINIKYTLRLSSRISDYLNWKADKAGMRKADWLRDKIKDIMKNDEEYIKYRKEKFSTKAD